MDTLLQSLHTAKDKKKNREYIRLTTKNLKAQHSYGVFDNIIQIQKEEAEAKKTGNVYCSSVTNEIATAKKSALNAFKQ